MKFTTKFNIGDTAYKQGWGGRLETVQVIGASLHYRTCNTRSGEYGHDETYSVKNSDGEISTYNGAEYLYKTEAQAIKAVMEK